MMISKKIFRDMIGEERNVYQPAQLYEQNRHEVSHFLDIIACPSCGSELILSESGSLTCGSCDKSFPVDDNLVDFREITEENRQWERLNEQFLNYHKSLTPFTLLNSAPVINYVSISSGIGKLKNIRVLDVGGGTGHMYCSFFRHPDTIDYYLLDPNLRLLHDQFIRVYPGLSELKISHMLGFSENLPFQNSTFDLIMSYSSIDHFKDYRMFLKESFRLLKQGGKILISSHLDKHEVAASLIDRIGKLLSPPVFERLARSFYFRKYRVGKDDHTYHFHNVSPIKEELIKNGFHVTAEEEFATYFYLIAQKA